MSKRGCKQSWETSKDCCPANGHTSIAPTVVGRKEKKRKMATYGSVSNNYGRCCKKLMIGMVMGMTTIDGGQAMGVESRGQLL